MNKSLTQVVIHVMAGNTPDMDDNWVPALQEIMKSCWKQDPLERPEMKDIMTSLRKLPEALERRRPGLAKTPAGESSKIYNQ